jgi:hypothetical protein
MTLAVVGIGLGAIALMVTVVVVKGEAGGHAFGHLVLGAALLGLFAAIGAAWHPRAGSSSSNYRAALLIVLWIASVATFLESIGAAGYDQFNAGHRLEWLTALHGMATPIASLGILLLPLSVGVLAITLVGRLVTRRRGPQSSRLQTPTNSSRTRAMPSGSLSGSRGLHLQRSLGQASAATV